MYLHLDNINLEFSGFLKTFDILFDNIFSNFSVQNRISTSIDEVNKAFQKVSKILNNLLVARKKRVK